MGSYLELREHMPWFVWDSPYAFCLGIIDNSIPCVKIIKENNLVYLSKFYFTLHEGGSLHSQESRKLQNKGKGLQAGNKEEALGLS